MSRPYCEMDIECYVDWFLVKFYPEGEQMYSFPIHYGGEPLNFAAVQWFIDTYTLVTFNGINYDIPMLSMAMRGYDPYQLRQFNNILIVGRMKWWDFYKTYGVEPPRNLDHVDIMEVAPGVRLGLKVYAGRMHAPKMQDLPYDSDYPTTLQMRQEIDTYCGNDLQNTRLLRQAVTPRLELRQRLGERFGVDVRSKSDAQIAEAAIKAQLLRMRAESGDLDERGKPRPIERRQVRHGHEFQYKPAPFIRFSTPKLQAILKTVCESVFVVNDISLASGDELFGPDGKKIKNGVCIPDALKAMVIRVGGTAYKFGIGGIHSQESAITNHTVMGKWSISDHDVASYYPSLILLLSMYPEQLGPAFLEVYKGIYEDRLSAKDDASKYKKQSKTAEIERLLLDASTISDGFKIVLNGTFGKLFSKYSIMFAPELGIQVTITGQLCMLMLIESLELCGISVISANTDGIVLRTPVGREWLRDACIANWQKVTGLETEANYYRSLYSRDVNAYVAIKMDGTVKGKGAFAESGVLNNVHPDKDVCTDAAIAYLKSGTRLDDTIRKCTDIRRFLSIRNAKGGAVYKPTMRVWKETSPTTGKPVKRQEAEGGEYLGKTVRWYYRRGETDALRYKGSGNIVAGSDGARPVMQLPDTFPDDIDYDKYHEEAIKMLKTLGVEYAL